MFQQVYLHKATRAAEWMIHRALGRAAELLIDGERLAQVPRAIELGSRGEEMPLHDYLELDDGVIAGSMHAWEQARDPALADLCKRIRDRRLFKTFELFGEQAIGGGREEALARVREAAAARGLDPDVYVGLDVASDIPFGAEPEPLLVVFAKGPARPLSDVSFLLTRLAGQLLSRVRLVFAPELRDDVIRVLGV